MALMPCEECGQAISSKATACPGCGWPVPSSAASLSASEAHHPQPQGEDHRPPTVRVALSNPDSLGQAVVVGARAATRSRVWGKLFQTLETLSRAWGVLFMLLAAVVFLFSGRIGGDAMGVALFSFVVGIAPPLVMWGLGSWIDWLKK